MTSPSANASSFRPDRTVARTVGASLAATIVIYLLTVAHHAYGAMRYDTPWRLHVLTHGTVALLPVLGLAWWAARSRTQRAVRAYAWMSFTLFGVLIGWFEGGYNHVLKNLVFFAGGGPEVLDALYFFARDAYEIPNDWLFEISGVLQFPAALVQGLLLRRLTRTVANKAIVACPTDARVTVGRVLSDFTLPTIRGETVAVPDCDSRLVHLHFRRFAGCPICITHLRELAKRRADIVAQGIRVVVLFHSSVPEVRKHQGDLPFDVVADPTKGVYRRFGVEKSPWAFVHPRALWAAVRSAVRGKGGFKVENGRRGLPADVLIDASGRVVAAKYGSHAFDQWDADELLAAAAHACKSKSSRDAA